MEEITVEQLVSEERHFLHDMSNQIVIAQGMGNIVLSKLKKVEGLDPAIIEKQEKAVKAMGEQVNMLKNRRALLHSRT